MPPPKAVPETRVKFVSLLTWRMETPVPTLHSKNGKKSSDVAFEKGLCIFRSV